MLEKPSLSLALPRLLKAQFFAGSALAVLYSCLAITTAIFTTSNWLLPPTLLAFAHILCAWSLYRILQCKVYAGLMMRLAMGFALCCGIITLLFLSQLWHELPSFHVGQLSKDSALHFTSLLLSAILFPFPALTLMYSLVGEIRAYLHYLTIHDGES